MQHRGEAFRIGNERASCGGECPLRRDRGSTSIHDLNLERRLLYERDSSAITALYLHAVPIVVVPTW